MDINKKFTADYLGHVLTMTIKDWHELLSEDPALKSSKGRFISTACMRQRILKQDKRKLTNRQCLGIDKAPSRQSAFGDGSSSLVTNVERTSSWTLSSAWV